MKGEQSKKQALIHCLETHAIALTDDVFSRIVEKNPAVVVKKPKLAIPPLNPGYTICISSQFLSQDERFLAVGYINGKIILWDLKTGERVQTFAGHEKPVKALYMSSDNSVLASGSDDTDVRLWDVQPGKCLRVLGGHSGGVYSVAMNSYGNLLISGGRTSHPKLWNLETGLHVKTYMGQKRSILKVCFGPDESEIYSGSADGSVMGFNLATGQGRYVIKDTGGIVDDFAFNSDFTQIATCGRNTTLKLWDAQNSRLIKELEPEDEFGWKVCFSRNDRFLCTGGYYPHIIRIYEVPSGECVQQMTGHQSLIRDLNFLSDDTEIVSSEDESSIKIWSWKDVKYRLRLGLDHDKALRAVCLSPNGRYLAAARNSDVLMFDLRTGKRLHSFAGKRGTTEALCFNRKSDRLFASGFDGTARCWDTVSGTCMHVFRGHKKPIKGICLSDNEEKLITAGWDGKVNTWNIESGLCEENIDTETSHGLDRDERYLAYSNGNEIHVRVLRSGRTLELKGHKDNVRSIQIHPRKNVLISGSNDETVKLWDIEKQRCIRTLRGHQHMVHKAMFCNDSKNAVSASEDRTLRYWDLETGECLNVFTDHEDVIFGLAVDHENNRAVTGSDDGTVRFWDLNGGVPVATLYLYDDHALWVAAPEPGMDENWFYCENPEKLEISMTDENGNVLRTLEKDDPERLSHLELYNDPEMVMARIGNPTEYEKLMEQFRRDGSDTKPVHSLPLKKIAM